jgi:hypothetical protein
MLYLCHARYGVRMTTVDRAAAQGWVADDSTFGARLALIRQRMRWGNVKEAAVACGLPVESWRSWERDGRTPQRLVEIASIIADRTGCDFGWLVAGPRMAGRPEGTSPNHRSAHLPRPVSAAPVTGPYGPKPKGSRRKSSTGPAAKRRPTLIGPGVRAS